MRTDTACYLFCFFMFCNCIPGEGCIYLIVVTVQALLAALGLPCSLFQHLPASLQLMLVSIVAQLARYRHMSTDTISTYLLFTHIYSYLHVSISSLVGETADNLSNEAREHQSKEQSGAVRRRRGRRS